MLLLTRKKMLMLLLVALTFTISKAQEDTKFVTGRVITLLFSSYTVEQNKLLSEEFTKTDGFKIIYNCIPAGIVIIESEKEVTPLEKTVITEKIKTIKEVLSYKELEGVTQEQAEQACSGVRNSQHQKNKPD